MDIIGKHKDTFSFDEVIERRNTGAIKYDYAKKRGIPEDALPMWVADMDFRSPQCVNDALAERCRHGIYGYSDVTDEYLSAVKNWYSTRYGCEINSDNIVTCPGVVFGIFTVVSALTQPGDSVLIQRPVYYPFSAAVEKLGRKLVNSPLLCTDGHYEIDFEDFESKIITEKVRLFIMSNPHNPVGRVWTKDELLKIGGICLKHSVYIISDEIHSDFVYPGYQHTVFASLSQEISDRTVTCTAPSKTFNLAGLQISNLIITNGEIRRKFLAAMGKTGYDGPNLMGMLACQAAYSGGAPWLTSLLVYLKDNIEYVKNTLQKDFPGVRLIEPEGTYLLWIDFSALGYSDSVLRDKIEKQCGLWLDHGTMFGPEGAGYQRINIACPRATLEEAFKRLKRGLYA